MNPDVEIIYEVDKNTISVTGLDENIIKSLKGELFDANCKYYAVMKEYKFNDDDELFYNYIFHTTEKYLNNVIDFLFNNDLRFHISTFIPKGTVWGDERPSLK